MSHFSSAAGAILRDVTVMPQMSITSVPSTTVINTSVTIHFSYTGTAPTSLTTSWQPVGTSGSVTGTVSSFSASGGTGSATVATPSSAGSYTLNISSPGYYPLLSVGASGAITAAPGGAVTISSGANIQSAVDAHAAETVFALSAGTYSNQTVSPSQGSSFYGVSGTIMDGGGSIGQAFQGQGVNNVTISGIQFQNYAPAANGIGVLGTDASSNDWVVQGCTFTNITVSEPVMSGENMIIQNCYFYNNALAGIGGFNCSGVIIRNNTVYNNNTSLQDIFTPDGSAAGIKVTAQVNCQIVNNHVYNNNLCPGIWLDIGCTGTTIQGNLLANNGGPGIIDEIDYGCVITENVITQNNNPALEGFEGGAIYVQNSQNATINGNWFINNVGGIWLYQGSGRGSGNDGPYVVNNDVIFGNLLAASSGNHGSDSTVSTSSFTITGNANYISGSAHLVVSGSNVSQSQWQTDSYDTTGSGGSFNSTTIGTILPWNTAVTVTATLGKPVITGVTFTASSNKSGAAVSGQTIGALTISNSPTSCAIVGGSGFFAVSSNGIITVTSGGATTIVPTGTGATYNVVVNASNGSGTSSNVTIPVIFYPDGALDAPTGTPQYPNLFGTYGRRPPWQVAGVDYYVGLPSGTSLSNPTSGGLPAGASYNSSTHQITLSTAGTTFQGWDMSVGNGVGLIVNAANCVVKNNKFIMGTNDRVPILIETNGNSCYIGYNLIDEGGHLDTETFGGVIYVVFANNTLAPTIEYNEIRNGASDMIDIGKGLTLNRFNLMTQDGEAGGHPDFQQTNPFSSGTGTQQMYFNTWINTYGVAGSNGQGASIGDNSCPVSGACSFNNNVLIANGPGNPSDDEVSISYWINVTRSSLQSGATVSVQNNWVDISSAYGFAYPGSSGGGVTFANNTDLVSGVVTPSVPAIAASVGYNANTFDSAGFSTANVDMGSTFNPGFQWYPFNFNTTPTAANVTINGNGSVTLGVAGSTFGGALSSAGHLGSSPNFVGTAIGGGAYIEAVIKFNAQSLPSAATWPSVWTVALEGELQTSQWPSQATGYQHFIEVDIFEYFEGKFSHPLNQYAASIHDWYGPNESLSNYGIETDYTVPQADFSNYNTVAMLWVPATGSADGYINQYFNGTLVHSQSYTQLTSGDSPPPSNTTPWAFGIIDEQHLMIQLGSNNTYPITVQSVNVWQTSNAGNLTN